MSSQDQYQKLTAGIQQHSMAAIQNQLAASQQATANAMAQTQPFWPAGQAQQAPLPRDTPRFGVLPGDYPPETLRTLFYIDEGDPWNEKKKAAICEFFLPFDTSPRSGADQGVSFPIPAFTTREAAQAELVRRFRTNMAKKVGGFLEQLVAIQLEDAMTGEPECDLADAMRKYLGAVTP